MRRLSSYVSASVGVAALALALGLALGPGCRDATQITVDISLAKRASCTETNGTALTVGTEPDATERRVTDEFVTATTNDCTEATHEIGTLVVTPGESGRGSIVVVVAYDKATLPSSCKPPLYKGCIVARRRFSFSKYQQLRLPITIDPVCKDVPCDAFSTCRTGKCFPSDAPCDNDVCTEPGDPGDGGTAVDGEVIPEAGGVDGSQPGVDGGTDGATGTDSGITDSGTDASDSTAPPPLPGTIACVNGVVTCPSPISCLPGQICCATPDAGAPICTSSPSACGVDKTKYCCSNTDCGAGALCSGVGMAFAPLPNGPKLSPMPFSAGTCN